MATTTGVQGVDKTPANMMTPEQASDSVETALCHTSRSNNS